MKRTLAILICILSCILLCSCSNRSSKYISQDIENINYNNVTASSSPYWIDNNGVYFCENNLFFKVRSITDDGLSTIKLMSEGCDLTSYENKLYMYESIFSNDRYTFTEYDVKTQKKRTIITIDAERIENCYVYEDTMYVVKAYDESLQKDLFAITLDGKSVTQIAENILACSIIGGDLWYITESGNQYEIFRYNHFENIHSPIGSFEYSKKMYEEIYSYNVNFTSEKIVLLSKFYDGIREENNIITYDIKQNTVSVFKSDKRIDSIIAYEDYAFAVISESSSPNSIEYPTSLYRMNLSSNEMTKICNFDKRVDIFVTSDKDVYVSSGDYNTITHYTSDGVSGAIFYE